ncbi:Fc.00g060290.m01.CDS01 [Cosmosporella sp. VM-42]
MDPQDIKPKPEFELFKELSKGVWIAVRRGDPHGERFLAHRINQFDSLHKHLEEDCRLTPEDKELLGFQDLLYEFNQANAISQILNHENLVSLVGHIHREPFVGVNDQDHRLSEDYYVLDFCDAGNLKLLFDTHQCTDSTYYLPESLCWHVLRSLTRAVMWLHDGKRPYIDGDKGPESEKKYLSVDKDWLPILHRAIQPANVYFQHPRGIETYGLCKLGNFSKISVTGHAVGTPEGVNDGFALTTRRGTKPLQKLWDRKKGFEVAEHPYTLGDEFFSIGAVVFTMMTGITPTTNCKKCGCSHVTHVQNCLMNTFKCPRDSFPLGPDAHMKDKTSTDPKTLSGVCEHDCSEDEINIDAYLGQARYSDGLRRVLHLFLLYNGRKKLSLSKALNTYKIVDHYFMSWKETEEGREYKDVEDDMAERWRVSKEKGEQERLEKENNGAAYVI